MTCFETAGKRNSRHHRDQALKNTTKESAVLWLKCCPREPGWLATVCIALALAVSSLAPSPARAQEGDGEQVRETLGPYDIGVTITQSTGSVGPVHFIITLLNATTRQPVPDARVRIRTRNEGDGTGGWALALNNPRVAERYEANVNLETGGTWEISIEVSSAMGEVLLEIPPLEIRETAQSSAGGFVFAGVALVIVLGGVFVWWSIHRGQRKRAAMLIHGSLQEEVPPED